MSQARTVTVAEYLDRLTAAEQSHDSLHVARPDIVAGLRFATPYDRQIAAVEEAVKLHRDMAKRQYESSLRWKARGLMDRRADNLRACASSRQNRERFALTLRRIVAERDATIPAAAQ